MLIVKFWNYLRGYIYFRLEGLNLERNLNIAFSRNIYIWDINRINDTTLEAKTSIKGYEKLQDIFLKTGCKGKIIKKVGWPFFIGKIKKRKTLAIGLLISIILMMTFTSFVWTIEVNCKNYILEKDILIYLNKTGIKRGLLKYKIDIPELENKLLINYDRIAWVDIDIRGTKVIVNIIEKNIYEKKSRDTTPSNIVAKKKGIIEKVIAKQGDAVVKEGDVVKQNQVLISGIIKRNEEIIRFVNAIGDVYARTYYDAMETLPIKKTIQEKTGNTFNRKILKFGNASIMIGSEKIPFDKYILHKENKLLKWRNIKLPVEFIIEEYYEVYEKEVVVKKEDVKKALEEKLMIKLIPQIPEDAKILNKSMHYDEYDESIVGKLIIEVIESIGIEKNIESLPINNSENNLTNN